MRTRDGLVTDAEYVTALYDQEIRYLDDGIGEFVSSLDDMGLSENTLLLFTGDHGESMTEHGIYFDHHGLYDSTIHVPLIARWPGTIPAGLRSPHLMQIRDIGPTVMEAAGVPCPPGVEGESMWRLMTGEERAGGRDRVVSLECTWQAKWSLRTDRYKFILARIPDMYGNPSRELYDLQSDPGEQHNRALEQPDVAAAMEDELEGWIADRLKAQGATEDPLLKHGISLTSRLTAAR
jgi:arylsulfatase A-like enzyme